MPAFTRRQMLAGATAAVAIMPASAIGAAETARTIAGARGHPGADRRIHEARRRRHGTSAAVRDLVVWRQAHLQHRCGVQQRAEVYLSKKADPDRWDWKTKA